MQHSFPNQNDDYLAIKVAPKPENISPREQFPPRGASALREGASVTLDPTSRELDPIFTFDGSMAN